MDNGAVVILGTATQPRSAVKQEKVASVGSPPLG